MLNYIIKRVLLGALTMFVIITITFFMMHIIPGGPFLSEKPPTQKVLDALNEKFGLDKPLYEQYFKYLSNTIRGDFGPSIKKRGWDVIQIIGDRMPVSATIALTYIPIALLIGVPLGCVSALKRNSVFDRVCQVISTLGISVPAFVLCTLLLLLFCVKLEWLPVTHPMTQPRHMILPVVALAVFPLSNYVRIMRSSMLDIMGQDYMRTARAKGLSQTKALFKHAMRNAIIPIVTWLGPQLAYSVMGALTVERILSIPGLGREMVTAINGRDYPMIMGLVVFLSFLIVVAVVISDLAAKAVDPRIKLE